MSDVVDRRHARFAEAMLLITTAVWGASFALAKEAGDAINRAAGDGRALGPIFVLAMRFTIAAFCVALALAYRRRKSRPSTDQTSDTSVPVLSARETMRDGAILGGLLAGSSVVQHLALERTSEATAAFLTSLTVIFVPLTLWIARGRTPGGAAWIGVALAVPGVYLMSGTGPGIGFGVGEALGIACAVGFAWHLLAVNRFAPRMGTVRACATQFATVGVLCWPLTLALLTQVDHFDAGVLRHRAVWGNVLMLVAGPTLISFGLMAAYQPRVTPVRAVLIYLTEPIFAAIFAWIWTGRVISRGEVAGGALILLANAIVEVAPVVWSKRHAIDAESSGAPTTPG